MQQNMPSATVYTSRQFDRAIRILYPALLRCAAQRVGEQSAPDVVQRALISAWGAIDRFDSRKPKAELHAWLRRFVEHLSGEHIRCSARHQMMDVEISTMPEGERDLMWAEEPTDEDFAMAKRLELKGLIARTKLTCRQYECLHGWLGGATQQEIAARLHIRSATVWEHIGAAIVRLKRTEQSEAYQATEAFYEEMHQSVYVAPQTVGARLAAEQLKELGNREREISARLRRREAERRAGNG